MEKFSQKVKSLKRFCPECFTQEIIEISGTSGDCLFECTWCSGNFLLEELVTFREKREKIIDKILT